MIPDTDIISEREAVGLSRHEQAFSLSEVMLSIVLIAVLAFFLGAGLNRAAKGAGSAKCLANLRSIASLLQMRARDNLGRLDHFYAGSYGQGSAVGARAQHWTTQLRKGGYLNDETLRRLACRGAELSKESASGSHYGLNMADPYGETMSDDGGGSGLLYTIRLATHPEPSRAIFMADSLSSAGVQWTRIFKKAQFSSGAVNIRHGGKANVVFVDGHAEAAGVERLRGLEIPGIYDEKGNATLLEGGASR